MTHAETILKDNKLRLTNARKEVLAVFLNDRVAYSHADLEDELDSQFDRVTIYRTLDSFLANGLIHKIPDDSGAAKYALCDGCSEHQHHDNHVHFKCQKCDRSECLTHLHIPAMQLPEGYKMHEANLLIEGICARCAR